jgi:DNA-binding MurR/RpiR family transcriptional regulator
MAIAERVGNAASVLTPSERRVADVVLADPQAVAFGTVARLAEQAGTSGPTVVRFAAKLGYQGFAELQSEAQREMADALRPATARIRERPAADIVAQVLAVDGDNVRSTLAAIDPGELRAAVALLADPGRRVFVLTGELARGAGILLATQLDLLRAGVTVIDGSPVRVARQVSEIERGDVVVVIEHRRYERWLLEALARARAAGGCIVALTDRALSPIATDAAYAFVVAARGVGPFDSLTASIALVHALAAGVAAALQPTATARLDAAEAAWTVGHELVDDGGLP